MSEIDSGFTRETDEWRAHREAELRKDFGWLSLSDLFWLEEGRFSLGSDEGSDLFVIASGPRPGPTNPGPAGPGAGSPSPAKPGRLGTVELAGGRVYFEPARAREAFLLGGNGTETPVDGRLAVETDALNRPTLIRIGDLQISAIERVDRQNGLRFGIRMRDRASPARAAFTGLAWYPPRPEYRVSTRFEAYDAPRSLPIKNVLGADVELSSVGRLFFSLKGRDWSLESAEEEGHLFVNFRDLTSGNTTYGSGRFLHADRPPAGEPLILDFNRAFSPPCAFTPYALCPLPTRENHMPIAIEAGELYGGPAHG